MQAPACVASGSQIAYDMRSHQLLPVPYCCTVALPLTYAQEVLLISVCAQQHPSRQPCSDAAAATNSELHARQQRH